MAHMYYRTNIEIRKDNKGVFELYVKGYYSLSPNKKGAYITSVISDNFSEICYAIIDSLEICRFDLCRLCLKNPSNLSVIEKNVLETFVEKHNKKQKRILKKNKTRASFHKKYV